MTISDIINSISKFKFRLGIEDTVDRLNYLYTVGILMVCASIATFRQYMMKTITCYFSNTVSGANFVDFGEAYCWAQGTMPLNKTSVIPEDSDWNKYNSAKILYYQWVPFTLVVQCIVICLPRSLWNLVCSKAMGTNIHHIMNLEDEIIFDEAQRHKVIIYIVSIIENKTSQHMWLYYILYKCTYLLNACGQIIFIYLFTGFSVLSLKHIIIGTDWTDSLLFPRLTYCRIPISILGSTQSTTAQCILSVNMFNEKIYAFLVAWMLLLTVVTSISIVIWILRITRYSMRYRFIKYLVRNTDPSIYKFTYDEVFILRIINSNTCKLIATDIASSLLERKLIKRSPFIQTYI